MWLQPAPTHRILACRCCLAAPAAGAVAAHRAALQEQHGVALLHFEQHLEEAVLIPGGCPHQVRNLASCCKVSVAHRGWAFCITGSSGSNDLGDQQQDRA
jgi:hypothetical protein